MCMVVKTGIQRFIDEGIVDEYRGIPVGIVTNHSGVYPGRGHIIDLLVERGVNVEAIFTPEHGLWGNLAAGVAYGDNEYRGIKVLSLYGPRKSPPIETLRRLKAIIFTMQDVGVRFYTYISTLFNVIEASGKANVEVVVLDLPNPITGSIIEGPILDQGLRSFVGIWTIPIRYGLTQGELAMLFNEEAGLGAKVRVVKMAGWSRGMWFDETGLPWIRPSPAIVNLNSAILYPGIGLFEGVNVNEGRGTGSPFQVLGAPWLNPSRVIDEVSTVGLRGFELSEVSYVPQGDVKYGGHECRGLYIRITDRGSLRPVKLALALMWAIARVHGDSLRFLSSGDGFKLDYLAGRREVRELIVKGDLNGLFRLVDEGISDYEARVGKYLLYA